MTWTLDPGVLNADGTRDSWDMWRHEGNNNLGIVRRDVAFPPHKAGFNEPFWSTVGVWRIHYNEYRKRTVGVWRIHYNEYRKEESWDDLPLTLSLEEVQAVAIASARFRGMKL